MSLKFYNTMTHTVDDFHEIEKGKIRMYTCGPTVYDFAHIGNFRSYVFEDLVKRYLQYRGYQVRHVMNITDIDDKTIRKAKELGIPLDEVSQRFIVSFYEDIDLLNIRRADVYPRATHHIPEMVALVETLLRKGFAYAKDQSVYFSIAAFPGYGRLAHIEKENLRLGTRVDLDEYAKENIQDFVMWKGKKEGEPSWSAPFGDGRPGWHIECSAMSMKYLGNHFDIHMGGVDNIFPHHENEIAQSEAATGETFVNYWIHCQHLVVDNRKMSKSFGNQFTLRDLVEKAYHPLSIRYLLLATHYRKLLNFTFEGLERAGQSRSRLTHFLLSLKERNPVEGESDSIRRSIESSERQFRENMDDDFNISGALGVLFDFVRQVNLKANELKRGDIRSIFTFLGSLNSVLGIWEEEPAEILDGEIARRIEEREEARRNKDFRLADQIRAELKEQGISLMDTPAGVKFRRER
jgi:cysteinyl-tRNA synthetase